jgi:TP901 family phage tail tape measure protein
MAKEIKFNIKLLVDGKEKLVTATSTVAELHNVLESAKTEADKLDKVLVNFNQHVEKFQNINNAISQIAGTLSTVTEESRTFSAAMNVANTMAGKSGDDFAKLKGQVAELSKTLPITRDQLANGLYQVISNGVPENNWLEYLQKSAKASIGGVADLGETVKVTSTIIKNYGLQWDAAESVQDKIQLTAKNGVTSFEQLAQALPRVTSNAATLGVSIDELLATFATLTGVSGNTAEVSTQLAAIFTALVKPSSEASKMAQQMGIEFDAAAIKAAGGMRNFLTSLDKDVKAYAAKSGMLEQEIYGKLFGSAESLRALGPLTGQLAAKFGENVDAMKGSAGTIDDAFGKVANSGAASFQMMKNAIGEFTDIIASSMSGILPYLNIGSQIGNSVVAVLVLTRAWQTFGVTQTIIKSKIIATNAASLVWNATSVRMNALVQVCSASFRGAAVSATTLKLAIQGLLVSTGVGIAIVALTEAISYLMSSSDKAANSTKELSEAELAAQSARQQEAQQIKAVYSELDVNISKLKNFKGSKEEEKRIVGEMNQTYGETMGYYSTVSQWYTALMGNSKAYCSQMINEIRIRDLANKAADLQQKRQEITHDENGKARRYSTKRKTRRVATGQVDAGDGKIIPQYTDVEIKGSSDLEKANAKATDLYRQEQSVRKQMENLVKRNNQIVYKKFKGYKPTAPTVIAPTPAKTTPKTAPGKNDTTTTEPKTHLEELQAQLSAAQKEKGNAMTVAARVKAEAKIQDIQAQIDEATKGKVSIEAEAEPSYIVQGSDADKRQSRTNAQHNIDRIRQDFEIGLIGKEDAERQIADINKQLEKLGVKPIEVHFKTYIEELQEQLHDAQQEFEEATTIDARVKADAKIDDIQRQIDEATKGKVSIEAETEPTYIVQGSAADKRQSHSNAQNKASHIQTDYEIGIIGKDEALKEIEEINRQLAEIGLKPIKIELDSKGFDKVFGDIKSGWGSIQGVGNGIQGISDALEGNGDAWQQVTGLINGFISIAEGIQGIVALFDMLTASTTAHAAASTTDAAATAGEAAAATANTAAKSGEAVANATASGAKMPFPLNLVAIAAGVAAVIAALAAVSGFATGGVIGGTSTSGDKKFARVNSGEMILNKFQQARLFGMIDGKFQPPTFTERRLQPVTMQNITNDIEPTATEVNINMNANARKILDMITDVKRVAKKSGKNYNV